METLKDKIIEIFTDLKFLESHSFKKRAYGNAIEVLKNHEGEIKGFDFTSYDGIGQSIQSKIFEIVKTGTCRKLETLKAEAAEEHNDPNFLENLKFLCRIPGVGEKTALDLISKGITTIPGIKQAVSEGKLSKAWEKRLDIVFQSRVKWSIANDASEKVIRYLRKNKIKGRIVSCGSLRRKKSTVKDIDLVVEMTQAKDMFNIKKSVKDVASEILTEGDKWIRFVVDGIEVDLRITLPESFGAMVCHLTGSKEWNIALRIMANKRNILINEYGFYNRETGERYGGENEKDLFDLLKIKWVEPEKRMPDEITSI